MTDRTRRGMWLFLVILFVVTTFGVSIYAFWQNTHSSSSSSVKTKSSVAAECKFDNVAGETLTAPEAYKVSSKVESLQTNDLTKGSGAAVKNGDCLTVKYYGTLAADGTLFDENFTQPLALKFPVGVGYVIPGWEQGLIGMQVGGTRRLVIPSKLAYGSQSVGNIPANSDLVFVVKLVAIK